MRYFLNYVFIWHILISKVQSLLFRKGERVNSEAAEQLIAAMKAGDVIERSELACLKGGNFTSQDLSGLNFSGVDLGGTIFFGCDLTGANFYNSNLDGADFTGADVSDVQFSETNLDNTSFGHATMSKTNCFASTMKNTTLTGASLTEVDLRTVDMTNARMREAKIVNTDCTGALLDGVDLSYSYVKGSIFNDADMRNAVLRDVRGYEASLWIGVDIRNINFSGAYRIRRFIVDQNYLHEFKTQGAFFRVLFFIWWLTSDCGRSLLRWFGVIVVQILCFAALYSFLDFDYKIGKTWFSNIYFSIVTTTTLGYGDIIPVSSAAQIISMIQVLLGYAMLGGFLSILTNKMARRAD